jgi:Tfp pilus assembly protein PilN
MINLLPPQVKKESGYAIKNALLLRYIYLLVFLILIVAACFAGSEVYLARQKHSFEHQIASKNQELASYKDLEAQAKAANGRLKAFKTLIGSQAKFSNFLADLAAHTPKGVFINSISLTGDDKLAVKLAATANSYGSAVSLRDALVTSPRIKEAAIDDISNPGGTVYKINLTVAFNSGAYK